MNTNHQEIPDTEAEYRHMESVGQVEYQKVRTNESLHEQQEFYQYGQEYKDNAFEELKMQQYQHQHDDGKDQAMQRLSTEQEEDDNLRLEEEVDHQLENEDSFDDCNGDMSDHNSKSLMQPHYFGVMQNQQHNLMQADAHGNNTDLESITQSKSHLLNLPLASTQQAPHVSSTHGLSSHNQSELYKAHMAMQCGTQMIPTHQSLENGYQTDLTSASNPPTAKNFENNRMANDARTTTEETITTPHNQSMKPPQIPSSQQKTPQPAIVVEYTEVFVWGEDKYGQLGIDSQLQTAPQSLLAVGGRTQRPDYIPVPRSCSFNIVIRQVACGEQHSAILTAQGHLYMMGSNKLGQLGVSSVGPPPNIQQHLELTDAQIDQMYTAGSPILVESLKTQKVEQVACGADFTMVICRKLAPPQLHQTDQFTQPPKSEVYSWGNNESGQLGTTVDHKVGLPTRQEAFDVLDEEIIQLSCGSSHSLFLTSERDVISCGSNHHGQCGFDPMECSQTSTPFKVAAFDSVSITQISAGFEHSLFLSDEGQVFASGSNANLQLGIGEGATGQEKTQTPVLINGGGLDTCKVVRVEAGFSSACISDKGELFLWGRGGQDGTPYPQKAHIIQNFVTDVSLGKDLGIAVDNQGLAWSWGQNSHGELGVGDNEPRVHPFPILNLKGKLVTKAHCGHSFVVCLGNNICKELPQVEEQVQTNSESQQTQNQNLNKDGQPNEQKKKKTLKKKKNGEVSKRRSTTRPHTSNNFQKFPNDNSHVLPTQKKSRMAEQAKNHSFGPINNLSGMGGGNSRASSLDRSTSAVRRQANARHATVVSSTSNKRIGSQERTLSNLQSKYGTGSVTLQHSTMHANHSTYSHPAQAMQITSMASHEKSRMLTEQAYSQHKNLKSTSGLRSPTSTTHQSRPQQQHAEYDSNRQGATEAADVMKTMKALKNQIKGFKDENKIIKNELSAKTSTIERLERQLHKLQHDDTHQRQIQELQSEVKRNEMKLRKMKERRNYYRNEKDSHKSKINEMQKDNEALFAQITGMQEQSHATREENASLKIRLQQIEKQLEVTQEDLKKTKDFSSSIKGQNDQVEKQLLSQIRYQESQLADLSGQLNFESTQKNRMAQEIVRLEKQVQSREDYMISLENEAIMLRKEIKQAKFNNEKTGYSGFVGNLTQLRQSRGRSTSNNRFGDRSTSAERQTVTLSNQNAATMPDQYDKSYDDLPQKDNNQNQRSSYGTSQAREPVNQFLQAAQQQDARTRLMMQDVQRRDSSKEPPFQGLNALKSQTQVASPRQPIQVYRDHHHETYDHSPSMPDLIKCIKSEPEIYTVAPQQLKVVVKSENDVSQGQENQNDYDNKTELEANDHRLDQNHSSNVLAVIPLEDSAVYEQSKSENLQTEPAYMVPQQRLEPVIKQEPLDDNSMVLQQQPSEQPTKQQQSEIIAKAESHLGIASCFSDQNKVMTAPPAEVLVSQTEPTARKVSTMIPLGAPKGDGDIKDQYKQMLMAKLDIKTIQKRRRGQDHSQEP